MHSLAIDLRLGPLTQAHAATTPSLDGAFLNVFMDTLAWPPIRWERELGFMKRRWQWRASYGVGGAGESLHAILILGRGSCFHSTRAAREG